MAASKRWDVSEASCCCIWICCSAGSPGKTKNLMKIRYFVKNRIKVNRILYTLNRRVIFKNNFVLLCGLLKVKFSYESSGPTSSSVRHSFLQGRKVTLPCSYQIVFLYIGLTWSSKSCPRSLHNLLMWLKLVLPNFLWRDLKKRENTSIYMFVNTKYSFTYATTKITFSNIQF